MVVGRVNNEEGIEGFITARTLSPRLLGRRMFRVHVNVKLRKASQGRALLGNFVHAELMNRLTFTSVRQVRHDQEELDLAESDTSRSLFQLSSDCNSSGCYGGAHGTGLNPNETQFRCRTVLACLLMNGLTLRLCNSRGSLRKPGSQGERKP